MNSFPANDLYRCIDGVLNGNPTNFEKLTQRSVYLELTSQINNLPTAQKSFAKDYPNSRIYELLSSEGITMDTKTRQFQYKIMHRVI